MTTPPCLRAIAVWPESDGEADAPPGAALLPPRVRGRASLLTRMIAQVVEQVGRAADVDLASVPLLVGSACGELDTTLQLLQMMSSDDGALSPARFQASVHNTASGQLSIATGNKGFSSCLAAGDATFCALLVEAHAWLARRGGDVVVALGEEALPAFFGQPTTYTPGAVALLLSADAHADAVAHLGALRFEQAASSGDAVADSPANRAYGPSNPLAPALAFVRAARAGAGASLLLPGIGAPLRCELQAPAARRIAGRT